MHDDLQDLVDEFNDSSRRGNSGRIIFPNERLAALWIHELVGQLSDGAWENHWYDHPDSWKDYVNLTVEVDPDRQFPVIVGGAIDGEIPDFLARDRNYGDLVEVIGGRMVNYVSQYDFPDYDTDDVRADLRHLNETKLE